MEELAFLSNAAASYDLIASAGSPEDPLTFPEPRIYHGVCSQARVYDPATQTETSLERVIRHREIAAQTQQPIQAYLIGRKLRNAIFGAVRVVSVLKLRDQDRMVWEFTNKYAAVKIIDWNLVRNLHGRHAEDPLKEIACLQYMSNYGNDLHPNVIRSMEVLTDDHYIYSFMPFCSGGELFEHVERDGRFEEPVARYWFQQILQGLYRLQQKGVCHRDLSLENLLVDESTNCLIIDLGMCVRVPFSSTDGTLGDVTAGALRRLIRPQGACGKPAYVSPEVLSNRDPFDGFAIDLWAAGVILFIMLVGLPPWEMAHDSDHRFTYIATGGGLMRMLAQWDRTISPEAGDLLQKMLWKDVRSRLSLLEVMNHRWVTHSSASQPATQL